MRKWKCTVCGYIYDESKEGVPFEDLPKEWTCPQCGAPKSAFIVTEGEETVSKAKTSVADKIVSSWSLMGSRGFLEFPVTPTCPWLMPFGDIPQ